MTKSNKIIEIMMFMIILIGVGSTTLLSSKLIDGSREISINLPNVRPDHGEQYLCIAHRLPVDERGQFIVGFNPKGDADRVHHMLMYGCQRPGVFQRDSPNTVWDCGEMHSSNEANQAESFEQGPVCSPLGGQHILYGWALNAPALKLPKGVGFKVGGIDTDIHFLVLQVHYGHFHAFQKLPDLTDNSGLVLDMKDNDANSGITRQAGVLLLISLGQVQKGKSRHEIWCDIEEDIEIHPFRYRVHTHKLGTRVLGAKLGSDRKNYKSMKLGTQKDIIIGTGDPQKPQMFYPVKEKNLTIRKGDTVYANCDFNNNKTHIVNIGSTGDDEMCNFYLMYWTDSPKLLTKSNCYGENPSFSLFPSLW